MYGIEKEGDQEYIKIKNTPYIKSRKQKGNIAYKNVMKYVPGSKNLPALVLFIVKMNTALSYKEPRVPDDDGWYAGHF